MESRSLTSSQRILIVDDNDDAAFSLSLLLSIKGHEVRIAHDGRAALEAASSWTPNVVFLDISLPDLDGFEVARRLRRVHGPAAIRLIGLSGIDQLGDCEQIREAGFDVFLSKPAAPEELYRAMTST